MLGQVTAFSSFCLFFYFYLWSYSLHEGSKIIFLMTSVLDAKRFPCMGIYSFSVYPTFFWLILFSFAALNFAVQFG